MSNGNLQEVEADSACFVCGQQSKIGLKAGFETDKKTATSKATLRLSADYQGWHDVIHGGIVAALLDEACVYACLAKAEQAVTAELQIRYRKPVPVGAEVTVSGALLDCSRKVWQVQSRLLIDDTLYAEATAKVFILKQ